MAFEADFPFGTIKRKPSIEPKIPLTSTTRNLAKHSDDALVDIESSSSGEEGRGKSYQYGTLRLRRSFTDEKLKALIYEKVAARKDYDSVSGSTSSITPPSSDGAVEDEEYDDDIDLPLPPPPETLSSSLSTLSLISLPPPPDEYLDSPPSATPEVVSLNVTPKSSPIKSPEITATRAKSVVVDCSSRLASCRDNLPSKSTNGNEHRKSGPIDNDLGLSELMRLVDELEHWKPVADYDKVPNREERIYDTVEKRNTAKSSNCSSKCCKPQPIYQEVYQVPQRVGHAYVNLNEQQPIVISPTDHQVNGKRNDENNQCVVNNKPVNSQTFTKTKIAASFNHPPPLSQRSPMKGPLPPPPDMFIRDLHRVMEKKWKVAQSLATNAVPQNGSQVLGFRDPQPLSSASSSSASSHESSSSSLNPCFENEPIVLSKPAAPRIPLMVPMIPVMKLRSKAKKLPPPPPKRSATTQLSEPEVSRRLRNRGTIINRDRSIC